MLTKLPVNLGFTVTTMKSRRQHNSEVMIPVDLIVEILSRLSVKSIARCRCVSKFWYSILIRPEFTELFLTISASRPKILFACQKDGDVFYFSSPQPQNPNVTVSSLVVNYHMKFPCDREYAIRSPLGGLVCYRHDRVLEGKKSPVTELVICNPSTGQSFTLPKMKTRARRWVISFFGYDPFEKQYKVLSMALSLQKGSASRDHQVLTLGTEKLSWRMTECGIQHHPRNGGICIDGILYYKAETTYLSNKNMLICFHVSSEKFSVVNVTEPFTRAVDSWATLINYHGKLASFLPRDIHFFRANSGIFEFFVLEDPEKQEWSRRIYELPPMWQNAVEPERLYCLGMTSSNEIVLSSNRYVTNPPFFVFYYDIERKTTRRYEILGMEAFMKGRIYIFPHHVEDVKLMQAF